nr:siderophore-interacting protein [Actinomyces sp.]
MTVAPFPFFPVTVAGVRDLTPSMRRVTFTGPSLADFADPGWDQRIKLVLPAPEGAYEHLPQAGEQWYQEWLALPARHKPPIRTYTTRAVRTGRGGTWPEVDVDMVLHDPAEGGPAARWLAGCAVGDPAVLLGPSRAWLATQAPKAARSSGVDFVPPRVTRQYLLGGDETAAPAIARILQDLPPQARGIAVIEMPRQEDAAYLPSRPGFEVRVRGRQGAAHGSLLVDAVAQAAAELAPVGCPCQVEEIDVDAELLWEVPRHAKGGAALVSTSLYAWLAGEAGAVRAMRRHLVCERGIDRRSVAFMGYWRSGRAES